MFFDRGMRVGGGGGRGTRAGPEASTAHDPTTNNTYHQHKCSHLLNAMLC